MANVNDIYGNSDALRASDLKHGVQFPVVIESVRAVQFDDGNKLEISFRGKQKVLLCNKTNALRIAAQHGDDYDQWTGKTVFIQRDTTDFRGATVECVRVVQSPPATPASQVSAPAPQQPVTASIGDDSIPF